MSLSLAQDRPQVKAIRTEQEIKIHPAFKNISQVKFVQEKTIKRMDWRIPEKHVVSKNAVIVFKDAESKM